MNWWHKVLQRLGALFRKEELDAEMEQEMRSHIEMQTRENITGGTEPEEARYAAIRQFGRLEQVKETCREARGMPWLEELFQDLRFGVRMLGKNKGATAVILATLGLGIGANTAIFSVVNAVLLQPLPFPDPDRLVQVQKEWQPPWQNQPSISRSFSAEEALVMLKQNRLFSQMVTYDSRGANLSGGGEPKRVETGGVSVSFFPAFGAQFALGRGFLPEEDAPGGAAVTVLSHEIWQARFGGDTNILGRNILLDNEPYTVVGVMAAGFQSVYNYDLYLPISLAPKKRWPAFNRPSIIARLKPGVSLAQGGADLEEIYKGTSDAKDKGHIVLSDLHRIIAGNVQRSLLLYLAGAGVVLLIACANVANLLLARAAKRRKEIAIRGAIGAGRGRIMRQLLVESLILSTSGTALGLLLAFWTKGLLRSVIPHLPSQCDIRVDPSVLGFALLTGLITGILFGVAPALDAARLFPAEVLKDSERGSGPGSSQRRLSRLLVVSEMALATVLLLGSGLLVKSFFRLRGVDNGFRPDRTLSLTVCLTPSKYPDERAGAAFFEQVIGRLREMPTVEAVGANVTLPLTPIGWGMMGLEIEGRPPLTGSDQYFSGGMVNADYFRAMGIPLKKGRFFTDQDRAGAPEAVLVNESFERHYFPGESALGKRLLNGDKEALTIVGVVGDVRQSGPEEPPQAQIYRSYLQVGATMMSLAVRTRGNPLALAPAVRSLILSVDKDQPIDDMQTLEQRLSRHLAPRRLSMLLGMGLSSLATVLASLGVYGLLAFFAAERTREIGVRMALGAGKGDVLRLILGEGVRLAVAGVFLGVLAACALTRLLSSLIYGVSPLDPSTFAVTSLLLLAIATVSCYLPARQATSVDPILALRSE